MLLNNFYDIVRMGMLYGASGYPIKLVDSYGADRDFQLSSYNASSVKEFISFIPGWFYVTRPTKYNNSSGISIGSGTGAAKVTDYWLEKQITSGITCSIVQTDDIIDSSGNYFGEVVLNIIATSNVVIGELGWSSACFLLDRTVLDTPISLSAGQTASIKYRITNASTFNV